MKQVFVIYDPKTDTKVEYPIEGRGDRKNQFGITLRSAVGDLINKIARKTGVHPLAIMTDESAKKFVLRVENKQ